jgi:tetratricopeptide (TPR) repeat protein
MRYLALALAAALLVSCSRDPNYLKAKYVDSGNKYFDAGRYREASIMYRKSIDTDKKYGPAYYRLALTDLKQGQVGAAIPALRRAHELLAPGTADFNDATLKLSEIMIVAAQGQEHNEAIVAEVQQMVAALLKRDPKSWEGHKLSGDLGMLRTAQLYRAKDATGAKKELANAIAEYRQALSVKPTDSVINLALARTLTVDGESAEAETLLKAMIDRDKSNLDAYSMLYRIYLSQRRLPDGEALLKAAIQRNPKSAQMRLMLAQFYFGTNRRPELTAQLNQMKADLKLFPDAYIQAGDFYLRFASYDEAIKQYREGLDKDPARKNLYLKHVIETFIREGKNAEALKEDEQVLKNDPKDPEAKGLKATFLLDKGDVNQALTDLESVVTAKPNNFVARFNLGRAHFARGEYEQARQDFDAAIKLRPDYIPARLAQTQVAMIRGDNTAASHDADALLAISPNNIQGRVMKAAALSRLGQFDESRKLLEDVLTKAPKQEECLLELGVLDLTQKKTKEAIDLFRRAYEAEPSNLRGLMGESRAYVLDGQPEKAVQLVQAEAQKNPNRIDLVRELGDTEANAQQYDAAIGTFSGLLSKAVDNNQKADLDVRIGQAYLRKGDIRKSIDSLETARKMVPNVPAIATNLAMLYEMINQSDSARKNYEMSIKLDPTNPIALNNLAYLITESNGDLDTALTYATRAKQRLPNHPEVNDTLGWIYLKKNLSDNAIETFRALVTSSPQVPIYHYHYAMALMQKGDRADAKKECQTALADKPNKQLEDQIHQLMSRLG